MRNTDKLSNFLIFSISKKKLSRVNFLANNPEDTDSIPNRNGEGLLEFTVPSKVTDNNFFYISGYMICTIVKNIDCLCNINGRTSSIN